MSKSDSGLFTNTNGLDDFYGDAESVIAARVVGLDLREHPTTMKQLSSKQKSNILNKIKNRTATKEEYIRYMWNQRFTKRRKTGVLRFWKEERNRIKRGEKTTRNWSKEQNEIKEKIANVEYIFLCDDADTEGLHKINTMKKKLKELGVETLLYEDDEQEESYLFDNLEQLHKEIEKECELYPD